VLGSSTEMKRMNPPGFLLFEIRLWSCLNVLRMQSYHLVV